VKIATWNVNSIRARKERLVAWLAAQQPDVLCLQELKTTDHDFPLDEVHAAGYKFVACCQKTYNGVAILTRAPLVAENVQRGMDDGVDDPQARLIDATVGGVRVLSVYVPNGQAVGTDKYAYKLKWLERLRAYLDRRCDPARPLVVCGDFNVAPEERDVYNPDAWAGETLFHVDARRALEHVRGFGLVDTFRIHHSDAGFYSWWDYRMLAFPKNRGLRIDHIFATQALAERCKETSIDRNERKGKLPSDHAPVIAVFNP
jgi:exodeoxyribonuclease-3